MPYSKRPRARQALSTLVISSAMLAVLTATGAMAEDSRQNCKLINGRLPVGCVQANAGTVIDRPLAPNLELETGPGPTTDVGFSISIDPVSAGRDGAGDRVTIAGETVRHDDTRDVDRLFSDLGVQMKYDGLGARPILNVSTADLRRSYAAGDVVTFRASSNYPAWIDHAEIHIRDRSKRGPGVTVIPVNPNGMVDWVMPATGSADLDYTLRVYDAAGRYDETVALPLDRSATRLADPELDAPITAAGEGEDRTARRTIPVRGGAVTVYGEDVPADTVITVMGETVTPDIRRKFVMQRILPSGDHGVRIDVQSGGAKTFSQTRDITIPRSEWFATGIADLTLGRDFKRNESYEFGRLAGFAQGTLNNGMRITASVDTRDAELKDLFSDFGRKYPDGVLRQIQPEDVFNTYGDESVAENLAPTSGKVYLRVDQGQSHLMWGDFKAGQDVRRLVRSDRTLYGVEGEYVSPAVTPQGEARVRASGFAAEPDTLVARDTLRGTGGTAYFLSRQDIQRGTETLIVELRDPVSGRVVESRRLVAGTDYRIDYVQGVVILTAPLPPSAGAGGVVSDRPLGDFDVNLVAQYEYAPTLGGTNGVTYGGRVEAWVTGNLRFGVSGVRETTGVADNTLAGADVLWRHSDLTFLSLDYATSEGPGFGGTTSINGGLNITNGVTAGTLGQKASAVRVEGSLDLAELGGDGVVTGYYDRKGAGFVSPQDNIAIGQQAWGVDGKIAIGGATRLTFGADRFTDDAGKTRDDARIGAEVNLAADLLLAVELSQTRRSFATSALAADNGNRTDIGFKLTRKVSDDRSYWVFGQATLDKSGGLKSNDRLGIGAETRLTEKLTATGEVSGGTQGLAAEVALAYAPNAGTRYSLGYRLDPARRLDTLGFGGQDRGSVVVGATSTVNDRWAYRAENTYSAFGSQPSLASNYGVTYTPGDTWQYDGGMIYGDTVQTDGTTLSRRGLSLGMKYSAGEQLRAGLRGEFRVEGSDAPGSTLDRHTWLVSGYYDRKTSDNWRFLVNIDAVASESDQSSVLDGTYVEARLGYAYRPVDNDRLNALFSYTYLYDLPGTDQVNIDGDLNGPQQRSHILNAALSYDLNPQWTLGVKYGFRSREQAARGSGVFTTSQTHLGILRLDYHVVSNWDIMIEGRAMLTPKADLTELGALAGVYRHFGNNLRVGLGYNWGRVSDDLKTINAAKEGVFLNLTTQF